MEQEISRDTRWVYKERSVFHSLKMLFSLSVSASFILQLNCTSHYFFSLPSLQLGARSISLWVHRNLFWQLLRDGNLHDSAYHTPRQPLQNHLSGHLAGWATPWSAQELLDGQHQLADIPARARAIHKGLLPRRLEENVC